MLHFCSPFGIVCRKAGQYCRYCKRIWVASCYRKSYIQWINAERILHGIHDSRELPEGPISTHSRHSPRWKRQDIAYVCVKCYFLMDTTSAPTLTMEHPQIESTVYVSKQGLSFFSILHKQIILNLPQTKGHPLENPAPPVTSSQVTHSTCPMSSKACLWTSAGVPSQRTCK